MITDKNILASKATKGPWELDKDLPHWVKGKDGIGDVCKISNHSGYEDLRGTDLANAHIISVASEAIDFIADLLHEMSSPGTINGVYWVNKGEEILKKAYNL